MFRVLFIVEQIHFVWTLYVSRSHTFPYVFFFVHRRLLKRFLQKKVKISRNSQGCLVHTFASYSMLLLCARVCVFVPWILNSWPYINAPEPWCSTQEKRKKKQKKQKKQIVRRRNGQYIWWIIVCLQQSNREYTSAYNTFTFHIGAHAFHFIIISHVYLIWNLFLVLGRK